MKLLAFESCENAYRGYAEVDGKYVDFTLATGMPAQLGQGYSVPVTEFRDYDHFVGVLGKFDPYLFFLAKPRELADLTYLAVERIDDALMNLEMADGG